jgi:NADPH:quinone reductase
MRALLLEQFGKPLELRSLPIPVAAAGEVLVRIAASAVNPLDLKIRDGQAAHAKVRLPAILGMDMAGTVESVGKNVDSFSVGDEVFGLTGGIGSLPGSLAEFVAVDARLLALKPTVLSMREAAALPLTFVTAWEGLVDRAALAPGDKVLIHGGAGGVGNMCVQLARSIGATIFATGSSEQFEVVAAYGATPIDRRTPVEDYVAEYTDGEGFDVVYDTVGGPVLDASFKAARLYGGHVVSALGWGSHSLAELSFRAATYSGVFTLLPMLSGKGRAHHGEILRRAATLCDRGLIRTRVDPTVFPLERGNEAHAFFASRGSRGKVVVSVSC